MPVSVAEQPDNSPIPILLSETALISFASEKLGWVIVSTAATGAGKTLTFWLPILAGETAMTFIIVPLNVLGQQMADNACALRITSFNATHDTIRGKQAIKVCINPINASV